MKEIGKQLREAREQKKLSVHEVAVAIKINAKVLQAIEDGDEETLPAKPFLRGFVQTYAKYLELNVDEIMRKFLEAHGTTKPKPQISDSVSSEAESQEEVRNKFELYKKIAYVVAAVVAVVFIYFIQQVVDKYEQESKIAREHQDAVLSQIPSETETPAPTEEPDPSQSQEATNVESTPAQAPVATKPEPAVAKPEPIAATKTVPDLVKAPEPKVEAPPTVAATPTPVPTVAEQKPTPTPTAAPTPAPSTGRPQQLIIEALDNVEVRYTKDNDRERTIKLRPEQILTIRANEKVSLKINDSGAVNVIHNGRDRGVPGNLGQPTTLKYP